MGRSKDPIFELFPELINLAGRQRMLSQRIGLYLLKLELARLRDQAFEESDIEGLRAALELFEQAHMTMVAGRFRQNGLEICFTPLDEGLLVEPGAMTLTHFISSTQKVIEQLLGEQEPDMALVATLVTNIPEHILGISQKAVEALHEEFAERAKADQQALSKTLDLAGTAIKNIEEAARYSKLVSLNARVAADRAGEQGAEFSALSKELNSVADRIGAASADVRSHLRKIL